MRLCAACWLAALEQVTVCAIPVGWLSKRCFASLLLPAAWSHSPSLPLPHCFCPFLPSVWRDRRHLPRPGVRQGVRRAVRGCHQHRGVCHCTQHSLRHPHQRGWVRARGGGGGSGSVWLCVARLSWPAAAFKEPPAAVSGACCTIVLPSLPCFTATLIPFTPWFTSQLTPPNPDLLLLPICPSTFCLFTRRRDRRRFHQGLHLPDRRHHHDVPGAV